jgi:hypothetical protein
MQQAAYVSAVAGMRLAGAPQSLSDHAALLIDIS